MGSTMRFVWCLIIALALAAMATTSTASTTYKVGDDQGWKVPKDDPALYMAWPVNKTFTVGDKLGKHIHNT
uniref:Phytocyanin domain-containing protein n=1 Tax=Cucumis melo TaxID=3656 RepID=A0A9I9EBT8_CUCME